MKLIKSTITILVYFVFVVIAGANEKIGEIASSQAVVIWISEVSASNNSGTPGEKWLGTQQQTLFCALAQTELYRHGDPNRGGLSCKIDRRQNNWYLDAEGPTHNQGTSAGAAQASCKAVCIGTSLPDE